MPRYEFNKPRLFIDDALGQGLAASLSREQANYLRNVLRLESGAEVLVFNGRDGEFVARLEAVGKKTALVVVGPQVRAQEPAGDLDYVFAPLKHARLDYMVQKVVEMGASRLIPVITRRTQASRINLDRMRANVIEAAEQCGVLAVPEVCEPRALDRLLASWPAGRLLVFCDEDEPVSDPVARLRQYAAERLGLEPLAVLIGPEGGFDPAERKAIAALESAVSIALGPRILRADTAAVAALAVVQAALGDWRK